jgi:hypothetical protein
MSDPSLPTRRLLLASMAGTLPAGLALAQEQGANARPADPEGAMRVAPKRATAPDIRIDDAFAFSIRLTAFGFKGDGVADDLPAWRAAIAFARARNIRQIVVPAGVSIVSGSIVDREHPLPPGLSFVGEGPCGGAYFTESRLKYTGSGVCWDISYPKGAPEAIGGWSWRFLTFECAAASGTMFSFGDPLNHQPDDDPRKDPHRVLQNIAFESCLAFGPHGTGDFLRACKAFEISIDSASAVYSFRRGIWLKGCDNCRIQCRMAGNNRNWMNEASGAFGNNNHFIVNFLGGPTKSFGGEPSYSLWDSGKKTWIGSSFLLEGIGMTAHMYLAGYGTEIYGPQLGESAPFFELAPGAREIVIYSPRATTIDRVNTPIIRPAANPNLGGPLSDHRLRIYDAPQTIQAILPEHPRIAMIGGLRNPARNAADPLEPRQLGAAGPEAPGHLCTAQNYWAVQDSPGGGGIKGFVQDPSIADRWVIQLTRDNPREQGMVLNFVIGEDIQPGLYRLVNRMRLGSGTSREGWELIVKYDGKLFATGFTYATGTSYTTHADLLDLSATARGKTLSIHLYNSSAGARGADLFVEAIGLFPVADGGWTAGTGTPNKGAIGTYAAPHFAGAPTRAQMQALADALAAESGRRLALEQALRAAGIIV